MYLDPKDWTKGIICECHKVPILEEVTDSQVWRYIPNKMLITVSGQLALNVIPPLMTFNTKLGWYGFLWMLFGLKMFLDIFQTCYQIAEQCHGWIGIQDGIAVYSETEEKHDSNLSNLIKVAQEEGLVFNFAKCAICQYMITF